MKTLIYRHLKIFIKNPMNVVLSFLSSGVILSLYFLFIRDFTMKSVHDYGFISNYTNLFVDRLMTSGLLIVIGSTSALSIILIFIKDQACIMKDFLVTPISKLKIIYSYLFTSILISIFITLITYILIELFFIIQYGSYSSLQTIISSILTILLSNTIACTLILIIALFINNFTSFTTFETLYGVVIGFFTGVYIPIGYYPTIIRNIFFYFPLCQTTSLLRWINTKEITENILVSYPTNTHHILYETFGIKLSINNYTFHIDEQLFFIFISFILLQLILLFTLKFIKK